jgi:signal transduction histidine kinase
VGVLSIQALQAQAYGERERLVFRSVCTWAAVALENARVCQALESAQDALLKAQDAEREARLAAERATQLKTEFLANTSHDLRTPLASLHGYLETLVLRGHEVSATDRKRYLETALRLSAKVNRLAGELQELALLESGAVQPAPERFEFATLVREVLRKQELPASRRSHRMACQFDDGLPEAWADMGMIERVLTNLLDNAVQHAPPGSEIRVEVEQCADGLVVTLLDNGPGIAPALRHDLFKRSSSVAQSHRPGGGGLGLLIVQRLLQCHGSDISLLDRPGWGAVFSFVVPTCR